MDQLVSRHGVGRVRHLSGKLLWIQQTVISGTNCMGQVPTLLKYSDVGTKCLPRGRLYFLLHEVGAIDPTALEMIGQEEHAVVTEQMRNKDSSGKVVKFVKRMSLVLGVQGLEFSRTMDMLNFLDLRSAWFDVCTLDVFCNGGYFTWRKPHRDLYQCWY